MSTEKLDSFNKILLATGSINYMASAINGVKEQVKMIPKIDEDIDNTNKGIVERGEAILNDALSKLSEVMESLGNYMSGEDCICPIDVYATTPAFNIIMHGKDDTDFDGETQEEGFTFPD